MSFLTTIMFFNIVIRNLLFLFKKFYNTELQTNQYSSQ